MAAAQIHAAERPNIVFILVDDLRWDDIGATSHPFVRTPNIDRIAREGAMFRNAFVTTPLCSPSRASFLTGQYARTHGKYIRYRELEGMDELYDLRSDPYEMTNVIVARQPEAARLKRELARLIARSGAGR